jgi:hypothetical protein
VAEAVETRFGTEVSAGNGAEPNVAIWPPFSSDYLDGIGSWFFYYMLRAILLQEAAHCCESFSESGKKKRVLCRSRDHRNI